MTRPVCRCLPSFVCACDRCSSCSELLTPLEVEQGSEEYHDCSGGECRVKWFHEHLKCNECRLADYGYFMLPSGEFALTKDALDDLDAGDTE